MTEEDKWFSDLMAVDHYLVQGGIDGELVTEKELQKRVKMAIFAGGGGVVLLPLCGLVAEFILSEPWTTWAGPADYEIYHFKKLRRRQRQNQTMQASEFCKLLELDIVSEIELTEEANAYGGTCFVFVRLHRPLSHFEIITFELAKFETWSPVTVGAIGCIDGVWILPFSGPSVSSVPNQA